MENCVLQKRNYQDSSADKAFRIVITHWLIPSNEKRKENSSNKIARWWIRICGSNRGFKLIRPYFEILDSYPPGLWRQTATCCNSVKKYKNYYCRCYHQRWEKKQIRMRIETYDIYKYVEEKNCSIVDIMDKFPENRVQKYFEGWYETNCACNLMPASVIINFDKKYNSIQHIFRIMASDKLTSRTRAEISNYLYQKLKPS